MEEVGSRREMIVWYADDIGVPPLESMTDGIAPNTEDNEQRTFAWAATTAAARIVERCVESGWGIHVLVVHSL